MPAEGKTPPVGMPVVGLDTSKLTPKDAARMSVKIFMSRWSFDVDWPSA